MRTFLVFLILLLLGFSESNSVAEELFLMRVVSVNQETGKISAEVIDGPDLSTNSDGETGRKESGGDTGDSTRKPGGITVLTASGRLPERLRPGSIVRVWGKFTGETGTFVVKKLFPGKAAGRRTDPTGVRRRLGKSSGFRGKGGGGGHGRK